MISTLCSVLALALVAAPASKSDAVAAPGGALGVRFGMSPSEVAASYPQLTREVIAEDARRALAWGFNEPFPEVQWDAETTILGQSVTAVFQFAEDRLYCIAAGMGASESVQKVAPWLSNVRATLNEKYGSPARTGQMTVRGTEYPTEYWNLRDGTEITLCAAGSVMYCNNVASAAAFVRYKAWKARSEEARRRFEETERARERAKL